MDALALYIHIPFCIKRCAYCDFNSYTELEYVPSYLDSLKREISFYSNIERRISSIYIGGGTPTVLNEKELSSLLEAIRGAFNVSTELEFTVEANPETVTREKLEVLREGGVNRLSLGLQSFNDELLKAIGRIHNAEGFLKKFFMAREAGFNNINVDLIFGLPRQRVEDFLNSLRKLLDLSPEHVSCYSLSVEEGTKFYELKEKGLLFLPSEDEERIMYHSATRILEDGGYSHYEISNFAKPGRECKHNLVYWTYGEYLGLGAGAHSFMDGVRFYNAYGLKDYIEKVKAKGEAVESRERISEPEQQAEFVILGLRLIKGVDKAKFYERFKKDIDLVYGEVLEKLEKKGLIVNGKEYVKLTKKGLDLANEVFVEFLP
ncbi:Oxygen-independent coproporphyrinogen-III oxidase-like protein YqeR [Fervidicola ferrireducens]|jgi:oxygen-independent coproporphyrinogen-3 oxidase|uniref:Heme chaperone HemW n=1 Tax=Fervidicola ferrireducens TaxID=520764 RepID=A0A140LDA1_9FIRM|nr:radical SAM family heme chaperone HemW [Fervidicola ferrireducens]KXG78526.1 Oxygen-independent coproporphyrinogen-III oxidase-like protein YqeR [Fervidicola ferrireducens]